MTTPEISLVRDDLYDGATIGLLRHLGAIVKQRKHTWGESENWIAHWGFHIEAALAELSVSRLTGLPWHASLAPDNGADVGELGVRFTPREHFGLRLHEGDSASRVFVLVTGREGTYSMRGSLPAGRGKRPEFWRADLPRPCYVVPQRMLDAPDGLLR